MINRANKVYDFAKTVSFHHSRKKATCNDGLVD